MASESLLRADPVSPLGRAITARARPQLALARPMARHPRPGHVMRSTRAFGLRLGLSEANRHQLDVAQGAPARTVRPPQHFWPWADTPEEQAEAMAPERAFSRPAPAPPAPAPAAQTAAQRKVQALKDLIMGGPPAVTAPAAPTQPEPVVAVQRAMAPPPRVVRRGLPMSARRHGRTWAGPKTSPGGMATDAAPTAATTVAPPSRFQTSGPEALPEIAHSGIVDADPRGGSGAGRVASERTAARPASTADRGSGRMNADELRQMLEKSGTITAPAHARTAPDAGAAQASAAAARGAAPHAQPAAAPLAQPAARPAAQPAGRSLPAPGFDTSQSGPVLQRAAAALQQPGETLAGGRTATALLDRPQQLPRAFTPPLDDPDFDGAVAAADPAAAQLTVIPPRGLTISDDADATPPPALAATPVQRAVAARAARIERTTEMLQNGQPVPLPRATSPGVIVRGAHRGNGPASVPAGATDSFGATPLRGRRTVARSFDGQAVRWDGDLPPTLDMHALTTAPPPGAPLGEQTGPAGAPPTPAATAGAITPLPTNLQPQHLQRSAADAHRNQATAAQSGETSPAATESSAQPAPVRRALAADLQRPDPRPALGVRSLDTTARPTPPATTAGHPALAPAGAGALIATDQPGPRDLALATAWRAELATADSDAQVVTAQASALTVAPPTATARIADNAAGQEGAAVSAADEAVVRRATAAPAPNVPASSPTAPTSAANRRGDADIAPITAQVTATAPVSITAPQPAARATQHAPNQRWVSALPGTLFAPAAQGLLHHRSLRMPGASPVSAGSVGAELGVEPGAAADGAIAAADILRVAPAVARAVDPQAGAAPVDTVADSGTATAPAAAIDAFVQRTALTDRPAHVPVPVQPIAAPQQVLADLPAPAKSSTKGKGRRGKQQALATAEIAATAAASVARTLAPTPAAALDVQGLPVAPAAGASPHGREQPAAAIEETPASAAGAGEPQRRPVPPEQLADRFLTELSRHRFERPRPLPIQFQTIADVVVGYGRRAKISTGQASQRALAAVNKVAATTGDVIHLAEAPRGGTASKEMSAIIAHELTHVAAPSPAPRFFDDDRHSAEERRATEIGDIIRRSPVLPSFTSATASAAAPAPAIARGRPDTIRRKEISPISTQPDNDVIARKGGNGSTSSTTPTLNNTPPEPRSGSAQSGGGSNMSDSSYGDRYSTKPSIDPAEFTKNLRANFDLIVELLEDRIIADLERRGGRFRGDF